jgi:Uma2 family endonuclease
MTIARDTTKEQRNYSPEEYLEIEINSPERHEYIHGNIVPMTGGTPNHNQIAGNFYAILNFALKRQPFRVFVTDQRLWIPQQQIYTYPDVMMVAAPIELQEGRRDTIVNPVMIAEVLSKSTKNNDRDEKFAAYRTISTFKEYLLIDQYKIHLEHYYQAESNKWIFSEYGNENDIVSLTSLPLEILLADIYDHVDFESSN